MTSPMKSRKKEILDKIYFYLMLLRLPRFCLALLLTPLYLVIFPCSAMTIGHTNKITNSSVTVARSAALITTGSVQNVRKR